MLRVVIATAFVAMALSTGPMLISSCSKANETELETTIPDSLSVTDWGPIVMYGKGIVFYAEVDKAGDYFRRMFIDTASARIVLETGVIPNGAILFLETWFGKNQSTVYIRQKVNGVWQSNSFAPANPVYTVSLDESCNRCHSGAINDQSFTEPLLIKALQRKKVQQIVCDEVSFTPCDASVYQGQ